MRSSRRRSYVVLGTAFAVGVLAGLVQAVGLATSARALWIPAAAVFASAMAVVVVSLVVIGRNASTGWHRRSSTGR